MKDLGYWDIIVVGGGLVGLAAALGLACEGARVLVFDAPTASPSASRGNFGLVWAQSKGANSRDYAQWTRRSVRLWPDLQDEIQRLCDLSVNYEGGQGFHLCLGEDELNRRSELVEKIVRHKLPNDDTRMINREELESILPGIGPDVRGASVSSLDGACQSLTLLRGLAAATQAAGAKLVGGEFVKKIMPSGDGYSVASKNYVATAKRVLIAAGLKTNDLARPFGFSNLVYPQKGQIIVTERTKPTVPVITSALRQTLDGTILIGSSSETSNDDHSNARGMASLANRAIALFPSIGQLRIVRSWAALRVLTKDGNPVYDESPTHPGVFVATTHSGVTLAPVHRGPLARWILGGQRPAEFVSFSASRFNSCTTHHDT
ncbi:MAG TPA: FAD-binding oxidoreductase [Woeseiaceae bacterium]|nr:FAD-binding oxidoreductase [Woeseiaceae bacterium]